MNFSVGLLRPWCYRLHFYCFTPTTAMDYEGQSVCICFCLASVRSTAHSRAGTWSSLVQLWKNALLNPIDERKQTNKKTFSKLLTHKNETEKIGVFHLFIRQLRRANRPNSYCDSKCSRITESNNYKGWKESLEIKSNFSAKAVLHSRLHR